LNELTNYIIDSGNNYRFNLWSITSFKQVAGLLPTIMSGGCTRMKQSDAAAVSGTNRSDIVAVFSHGKTDFCAHASTVNCIAVFATADGTKSFVIMFTLHYDVSVWYTCPEQDYKELKRH